MIAILVFTTLLVVFSIYSYVLIDPNLTFFGHPFWETFRNAIVQIGYHKRQLSWFLYATGIIALFLFHWWAVQHAKKLDPVRIAVIAAIVLTFSYPLLSHDLFNYMFDAKILTYYHQNPYLHRALDYPDDTWLRFMHWVHRTYPYGPVFLLISAVPSLLGMGKFLLHFFLIKALFGAFYLLAVWCLAKMERRWAVVFATCPLVLVEGLVNAHNEIVAVGLGIAGFYVLTRKQELAARLLFLASAGIKFMTAPYLIVVRKADHWLNYLALVGTIAFIGYAAYAVELQQWYFLNLFFFLPLFPRLITRLWPLWLALLLSYYPFIALGNWETDAPIRSKFLIIQIGLVIQILYLLIETVRSREGWRFLLRGTSSSTGHT
ncbi:MAG: hypothetical protein N2691_00600 [Patescibacteria group bacterium]|nr:hypothetical protein [Patescibacteria group bacterium]